MATLYEKLGGEPAIDSVIKKFYDYMLADNRVAPYFANTDMNKQRERQKQFISMVTGGPTSYEGQDMRKAHDKMNIGDKQFDATWENLVKSLHDHKVPQNLIDQVKEIFCSVKDDVCYH